MKRRYAVLLAAFAVSVGAASSVRAQYNPATGVFTEPDVYLPFGGPPPAGTAQYGFTTGFGSSTIGDQDGRVLSNAGTINNGPNPLLAINPSLWLGGDAVLFKVYVPYPSIFTAQIASSTNTDILALFNSSGGGLSAADGGGTVLNSSNDGITTPGYYYIGTSTPGYYPENAEGQNIFGLTATAGYYAPSTSDKVLSTTDYLAWTLPGSAPASPGEIVNGSTSFLNGSGADILVGGVPEPTSIGVLGTLSLGLLARRRKLAR